MVTLANTSRFYAADGSDLGYLFGRTVLPPGGNLFRSQKRHFVCADVQLLNYTPIRIFEAGVATPLAAFTVPGTVQSGTDLNLKQAMVVLDHGAPDSMLVAVHATEGLDSKIRLHKVNGQTKWVRKIGDFASGTLPLTTIAMAAGDVTGDGLSDVVYAFSPSSGGADSLGVIDGKTGARVWTVATGSEIFNRAYVRLIDIENDGQLEIVTNTRVDGTPPEDRIQCYSAEGALLWEVAAGEIEGTSSPPTFLGPADIDNDGVKEIVFARGTRLGVITIAGSSATVEPEVVLSGERVLFSTPLAVDIDGDDLLEIIVLCRAQDHYLNKYSLELRVFDDELTPITPTYEFPWVSSLSVGSTPPLEAAAADIDADGVVEVVFVTPDATLHAVRVGTSAGRADWTWAYGNDMQSGLYEQVLAGSYDERVAVNGRARVVSDATFTEGLTITAPADVQVGELDSLVVHASLAVLGGEHDSVRVRVDEFASSGSRWGGFIYGDGAARGNVRHAVVLDALTAIEHESPLKIKNSRISRVLSTPVVSADSLWLIDSVISGSPGNGVELSLGVVATIDGSLIENANASGIVCDSCAAQSKVLNTTIRGAGIDGIHLLRVHGFTVESSVLEDNASAGIRFDSADGTVSQCQVEGSATGIMCLGPSADAVEVDDTGITECGVGVEHDVPMRITNSAISNVSSAVMAGDTLWFEDSEVSTSSGLGIYLAGGSVGIIDDVLVQGTDSTAILCDSCSAATVINNATINSAGHHGLHVIGNAAWLGTPGVTLDSCTVVDCTLTGIRFDLAHGTVSHCYIGSGVTGIACSSGVEAGTVDDTEITGCGVGVEGDSPLRITNSTISNVSNVAVIAGDTLWFEESNVSVSSGLGIHLTAGAVGRIVASQIDDADLTAILCDTCAAGTVIDKTTISSAGIGIHVIATTRMVIDSCVVTNSVSEAIRFEAANGMVSKCRLEGNAGGIVCLDASNPVVAESKINGNASGVFAAYDSYPVLGYGSSGGDNCITNSTGYHVTNLSDPYVPIYAMHDYWGSVCCKPTKFYGYVECDSCQTSAACNGAAAASEVLLGDAELDTGTDPGLDAASQMRLPRALDLVSAVPNPFNPIVRIRFAVPAGGARIRMVVYDVLGRRVATLENGQFAPGYHVAEWQGVTSSGAPAASGIYFVQMSSGGFRKTVKIALLK